MSNTVVAVNYTGWQLFSVCQVESQVEGSQNVLVARARLQKTDI